MQMMGFLYCPKMASACVGVPGSFADASAPPHGCGLWPWDPGDPSGRVTASTRALLTECSQRGHCPSRGPSSIKRRSGTRPQGVKLSKDTEADVAGTRSRLLLATCSWT